MLPFEPVQVSGSAGAVYPTASYELAVGPAVIGNAAVWSEGATDELTGTRIFDIEMAIRNTTQSPIRLDVSKTSVDVTTHDGRKAPLGNPVGFGGSRTIAPDSSSRVGLHYALPDGIAARDVARFDFNWHLNSLTGDYEQSTRFMPVEHPMSEDLSERFASCNAAYRVVAIDECVSPPPPVISPPPPR